MNKLISYIKKITGYKESKLQKKVVLYRKRKRGRATKKIMDIYAIELLSNLFEVAKENEVLLWVEFGTLLGAYREKDFISHDYDIDTGMYANDYSFLFEDELLNRGFSKKRALYQKNVLTGEYFLTEVTFEYKDLSVDIFFSFRESEKNRKVYVYGYENEQASKEHKYNVREYLLPMIGELKPLKIKSLSVMGPAKPVETLKEIYGESFMIPDPLWNTTQSKLNVKLYPIFERYANKKGKW